ncbi:hypothetical protein AB0J25_12010 [Streptomyces sp. NPDC049910]|uniref:hypothetical protein n=1 Tax=Streptomyces sp. NPDC049910 TaxID=3155278 RepID=UPI003446FFE3
MTPSPPTPLEHANRLADRALTRSAVLDKSESFCLLWQRGIIRSSLIAHHRLVALALASHADYRSGNIPKSRQPYLGGLIEETKLSRGQVSVAITTLLQRGWIRRENERRDRHLAYEVCPLRLAIPEQLLAGLRHR